MTPLHEIFSLVCGQSHNWVVGGEELPFCQRCTGLYVGVVPALLLYLWFRPKVTNAMLWIHGMCLLLMVPFGYHLVAQSGAIRMLTGQLFAIGLVYYLTLLLADRWPYRREQPTRRFAGYFMATAFMILLMQVAVRWGGPWTSAALSSMGFGGLLIYGLLVLVNLLLIPMAAWELSRRRSRYSEI